MTDLRLPETTFAVSPDGTLATITIGTEAIAMGRQLVDTFASRVSPPAATNH